MYFVFLLLIANIFILLLLLNTWQPLQTKTPPSSYFDVIIPEEPATFPLFDSAWVAQGVLESYILLNFVEITRAKQMLTCFKPFLHVKYKRRHQPFKVHLRRRQRQKKRGHIIAYVQAGYIFINPIFFDLDEKMQVRTILHECSHLVLNTKDYAYIHEFDKYKKLSLIHISEPTRPY